MAKAKFEIIAGSIFLGVALFAVYRMPVVREVILKFKEIELKVIAGEIKEDERRYQESLKTRASVHLATIAGGVESGVRAKENLLISDLYLAEATLLSKSEVLGQRILRPQSLVDRIGGYQNDRSSEVAQLRSIAQSIEQQWRLERHLAVNQVTATLRLAMDRPSDREGRQVLMNVMHGIASDLSLVQNGSAYNLLGNLALAMDQRELAFEYLYQAYLNDRQHLPTLGSLGFALWKLNGDCHTSLRYSVEGYQLAWSQMNDFERREKQVLGLFNSMKAARPLLARAIEKRSSDVSAFFLERGKGIAQYLRAQYDSLRNTAVYCMAFERIQEPEARLIAEELWKSDPTDPDYLDTKAFVLMRFHKDDEEVREAARLLEAARGAAQDSHQRELAEHHLALVEKLKLAL